MRLLEDESLAFGGTPILRVDWRLEGVDDDNLTRLNRAKGEENEKIRLDAGKDHKGGMRGGGERGCN